MTEPFEIPEKTARLQINLEDDVRAFLLSQLVGNRLDPEQLAALETEGADLRKLSKPTYIAVKSGCDMSEDGKTSTDGCRVGAEGYMLHEDEGVVHLAFKCGDKEHEMHYTTLMPLSIVEMAKAMESVWPGSIMVPLLEQAAELGRATVEEELLDDLDEEEVDRLLDAVGRNPDFDFDEDEEFDEEDEEDCL